MLSKVMWRAWGVYANGIRRLRSTWNHICIPKPKKSTKTPFQFYRLQEKGFPTYFGYYDKTPFSYDNQRILAAVMTYSKDWHVEAALYPLRLGYYNWSNIVSGKLTFHQFGETGTWSWQQGCMLQWFPQDQNRLVIYNKLIDGKYGSAIQDIFTKQITKSYKKPIYAIDAAGKKAVSVNFSRLERLRPGYGYHNLPDETMQDLCPTTDGIWVIDLQTGECELLVRLSVISRFEPLSSMENALHYVNLLLFNPSGKKLVFLHLWQPSSREHKKRQNRLLMYDFDEQSLVTLDNVAIVTHVSWLSDNRIIAFRSFRYPDQNQNGYYCYTIGSNDPWLPLKTVQISKDGHPSPSPGGDLLVTDTYPLRTGDQYLYLCSLKENKTFELAQFFSPFTHRGITRCDLHPRWDRLGKRICVDSAESGTRAMYILDFERAFKE